MNEKDFHPAQLYKPEIRFVDIDAAGIVNNATYFNYFEQSRIQFFEGVVGRKWDWMTAGMVIARHEIDYLRPILFNDDVVIITWMDVAGNKSMQANYEIKKLSRDRWVSVAKAKTVMVSYDHQSGHSVPWHPDLLKAFENFEMKIPTTE